jgi:predicted Fe-Mo cluster-binding NifX family protein
MKIAVPADEKDMDAIVCPSFGRAPYFLIYDTSSKEASFIDNSAAASQGGAGIKTAQNIIDHKAEVLLTPRCGQNAAVVINAANIKIYKTEDASVKKNIDSFLEGYLAPLEDIHPGFHNHGEK